MRLYPNASEIGNSMLYGADEAWEARCRDDEERAAREAEAEDEDQV
jgi:hypothetical protein